MLNRLKNIIYWRFKQRDFISGNERFVLLSFWSEERDMFLFSLAWITSELIWAGSQRNQKVESGFVPRCFQKI